MGNTPDKDALRSLAEMLAEAQKENAEVLIAEVHPGESFESLKSKIRHERMHRAQHALAASGSVRDHVDWDTLLNHPLAERAARRLLDDGYPADDPILAAEIGAHLASGRIGWEQMGLSDQEAVDLFAVYIDLLNASNVKDVNAHLSHVDEPSLADPDIGISMRILSAQPFLRYGIRGSDLLPPPGFPTCRCQASWETAGHAIREIPSVPFPMLVDRGRGRPRVPADPRPDRFPHKVSLCGPSRARIERRLVGERQAA
jgi:hypothetical protein